MRVSDEERALLAGIAADAKDHRPWVEYADWLDDHGRADQAELIRLECRLLGGTAPGAGVADARARRDVLLGRVQRDQLASYFGDGTHEAVFDRGVIHSMSPDWRFAGAVPGGLWVNGDLNLYRSRIASLPADLHVGRDLNLASASVGRLPPHLRVGRDLVLWASGVESLPAGLAVGRDLYLNDTPRLGELPRDLQVGGTLMLSGAGLTGAAVRRIPDMPGLSPLAKVTGLRSAGHDALAREVERTTAV